MARKSIHLNKQTEQFIKDRTKQADSPNFSANVNAAFEIIEHLAKSEKPELSNEEWAQMYNVYTGSDMTRRPLPLNLAKDLLDYYGVMPEHLPSDCIELFEKLTDMTQAEQYAVLDGVRIFWASSCHE